MTAAAELSIGTEMPTYKQRITRAQINAYAEASGDHNPIHLSDGFAKSVGLSGCIAHGMLSMGIVAEALTSWLGDSKQIASLSCRFSKPLYPEDYLICSGKVTAIDTTLALANVELNVTSNRGDRVLTNAIATVHI